jgi:hypothetical protein
MSAQINDFDYGEINYLTMESAEQSTALTACIRNVSLVVAHTDGVDSAPAALT